jgi:cytochrome c oxidase subunit 2
MADSIDVLATLKLVYGIYAFIAISLIGWFGYRITKPKDHSAGPKPALFYTYIVVLAILGTGLHFLTYNAVPWVPIDLNRADIKADVVFDISYENHQMSFSSLPMQVRCGEHVVFNATSNDLTYGFGIFRADHIRSTEYSGPKGAKMVSQNALVVTGCDHDDLRAAAIGER